MFDIENEVSRARTRLKRAQHKVSELVDEDRVGTREFKYREFLRDQRMKEIEFLVKLMMSQDMEESGGDRGVGQFAK